MDYEKAFKEAYERASLRFGTNVANELFLEYKESKEERIRRKLIEFFSDWSKTKSHCWGIRVTDIMDWLEKQGEKESKKVPIWKHWKDGIAGGSEGEQIFLIKNGLHYSISSCLGYECDYIELSELDKLLSHWKPNDEQMEALGSAIDEFDGYQEFGSLVSLKKDLEKLKGE